ncbi:MAG TPA: hypothetical protein EYP00_03535, partial [Dehalococcoidia bacterium]|nr:hypothetical protein [Dehalococcoidia bacterium]
MSDYEPLNLSEKLNAGMDILGQGLSAEVGSQSFRGLPFSISADPTRCFISLNKDSGSVEIPVRKSAYHIIFAHRLLRSDIDDGGPVGSLIANYSFCMEGEQKIDYPIRERFEIASVPMDSFR